MRLYVVVDTNGEPVRGPWSAEGRARAYTTRSSAGRVKSQARGGADVIPYLPAAMVEEAFAAGAMWAADRAGDCCGCNGPSEDAINAEAIRYVEEGK